MKLAAFATVFFVFAVTGCYSPKVQSGGFACSATDDPPCPSGFFCVNGLCVDHPGSGGGGGVGGGGGAIDGDMSMSLPADMSMSSADMAKGPGDMAHASTDMACFDFGHQCGGDPTCCAQCCAAPPGGNGCTIFGYCALP